MFSIAAGCASSPAEKADAARRDALAKDIVGRWTGDPVAPPERVWFEKARFDVSFSDRGDFSAVAATYAKKPYELRFEGEYDVNHGDSIVVEERNLGGKWQVKRGVAGELTLSRGDITIALRKRVGS